MKDVVLINLPTSAWYRKQFAKSSGMPPLGIMYIATVLQEHDYEVELIDFAVRGFTENEFEEYLQKNSPKIVAISTYNESWLSLRVITHKIKSILPDTIIIAGGAFATFVYSEMLKETDVDIVSLGEGEYSTLQLCNAIIRGKGNIEDIDGIGIKKQDNINAKKINIKRIENLDELPFPNRYLIDVNRYSMPYTISTSRGCPGACIFCSSRAFWGTKVYMRSAKSVFDEIIHIYNKYNSNAFQIVDDTFTASRKRAVDVCNMINKTGIKFLWGCESRADVIDEYFLEILKNAGCNKIQIGLESADNDILRKLKKHVTIEQIEKAIQLAYNHGMYITVSYIVGHAFDTEETINKTINFAKMVKEVYGASVLGSVNTPFPGTEQYNKRNEYGINIHSSDWDDFRLDNPIIDTKNLTINQLRKYYMTTIELSGR